MKRKIAIVGVLACSACVDVDPWHNPTWDEFRESVRQDSHGAYIVDGDIALWSEEQLRRHYDAYMESLGATNDGLSTSQSALTLNQVNGIDDRWLFPVNYELTYCVDSGFGSDFATVVAEMEQATMSWSARVGVRYTYVEQEECDNTNNSVTFNVSPLDDDIFARAFFPSYSRLEREVLITDDAFTATEGGRDFQGILRHELGHTLGFRHEHVRLENPCTSETDENTRNLTEYDVDSVMHYPQCRPSGTGGYRQTELDYRGAMSVYGLAPALISIL